MNKKKKLLTLISAGIVITVILMVSVPLNTMNANQPEEEQPMDPNLETATFGAGCFWCVEAIYQNLDGVQSVISGYSGGDVENPSYDDVCSGETGHAEVTQIYFDPKVISYDDLLNVFWQTHDPTTLNKQGGDVGTQYRSVIFYHNDAQKAAAELSKKEADASGDWKDPIVTETSPFTAFYKAENYHQNYYDQNRNQPYCRFVIDPKLRKFKKEFPEKLKK